MKPKKIKVKPVKGWGVFRKYPGEEERFLFAILNRANLIPYERQVPVLITPIKPKLAKGARRR